MKKSAQKCDSEDEEEGFEDIVILDGQKVRLLPIDYNNDGEYSKVEVLTQNKNHIAITEPTELGESLRELNDDSIQDITRMSGIDMRSRLHSMEIPAILAVDTLVAFDFLPLSCLAFTRQKKRLSVSLQGQGRKEIVELVGGKRESEERKGMGGLGDKIKSVLGGGRQ